MRLHSANDFVCRSIGYTIFFLCCHHELIIFMLTACIFKYRRNVLSLNIPKVRWIYNVDCSPPRRRRPRISIVQYFTEKWLPCQFILCHCTHDKLNRTISIMYISIYMDRSIGTHVNKKKSKEKQSISNAWLKLYLNVL